MNVAFLDRQIGKKKSSRNLDKKKIGIGIGVFFILILLLLLPQQGKKTPAEFEVSNLSISSSKVGVGESVDVFVDVSNVGELSGDYTIGLKIDGTEENSKTVTLNGGKSTTVTFTVKKETTKSYSVEIEDLSQSFEVVEPAEFEVSNLTVSPSEVEPNQDVEISVDVKNIGEVEGLKALELNVDGSIAKTKDINLDGGESTDLRRFNNRTHEESVF